MSTLSPLISVFKSINFFDEIFIAHTQLEKTVLNIRDLLITHQNRNYSVITLSDSIYNISRGLRKSRENLMSLFNGTLSLCRKSTDRCVTYFITRTSTS